MKDFWKFIAVILFIFLFVFLPSILIYLYANPLLGFITFFSLGLSVTFALDKFEKVTGIKLLNYDYDEDDWL